MHFQRELGEEEEEEEEDGMDLPSVWPLPPQTLSLVPCLCTASRPQT